MILMALICVLANCLIFLVFSASVVRSYGLTNDRSFWFRNECLGNLLRTVSIKANDF